jgi:Ca2+-binding EF-hand superfamily protein
MRFAKTILAASALALASGVAFAKDDGKEHKGFNDIDKNADGHITKAEATAAGKKDLLDRWSEADTDKDGKLSRAEYLKLMAKEDANTVKEKVTKAPAAIKKETSEAKRRAPEVDSSAGATGDKAKSQ